MRGCGYKPLCGGVHFGGQRGCVVVRHGNVYRCAKQQSEPTHARACDTQTFTGALPVGSADCEFPLRCPMCGGQMHLIAFITEGVQIRRILDHIGVDSEPPRIPPARAPPLWDECGDEQSDDGAQIEPQIESNWPTDRDGAVQPAPDFEADQRISW
jgi:hypothetical protein